MSALVLVFPLLGTLLTTGLVLMTALLMFLLIFVVFVALLVLALLLATLLLTALLAILLLLVTHETVSIGFRSAKLMGHSNVPEIYGGGPRSLEQWSRNVAFAGTLAVPQISHSG